MTEIVLGYMTIERTDLLNAKLILCLLGICDKLEYTFDSSRSCVIVTLKKLVPNEPEPNQESEPSVEEELTENG